MKINIKSCLSLSLFVSFFLVQKKRRQTVKCNEKPNILFIFVDDLRRNLVVTEQTILNRLILIGLQNQVQFLLIISFRCQPAVHQYCYLRMLPKTRAFKQRSLSQFYFGTEAEAPETFIHHLRRNGYYTIGIGKISHYADGLLYGYTDPVGAEENCLVMTN